jgi:hypothetical protein
MELRNVAADHPDVVKDLTAKALAWQKSLTQSAARDKLAAGRPDTPHKPAKATADRATMFQGKDTNKDGKLTLDEYLHNFPDQAEGRRRFPTFDTNHDGVLTKEEFINMGNPGNWL